MVFVGTKRQGAVDHRATLARRQYAAGLPNRRIAANVERLDGSVAAITVHSGELNLLCACGREECDRPLLTVPLDLFREVRTSRHRFVTAVGHAAAIDDVITSYPAFEIVEIKPEHTLDDAASNEPARSRTPLLSSGWSGRLHACARV